MLARDAGDSESEISICVMRAIIGTRSDGEGSQVAKA